MPRGWGGGRHGQPRSLGRGEEAAGWEKRDPARGPTSQSRLTTPGRPPPGGPLGQCVLRSQSGGERGGRSCVREGVGLPDGGGGKKEGRL